MSRQAAKLRLPAVCPRLEAAYKSYITTDRNWDQEKHIESLLKTYPSIQMEVKYILCTTISRIGKEKFTASLSMRDS